MYPITFSCSISLIPRQMKPFYKSRAASQPKAKFPIFDTGDSLCTLFNPKKSKKQSCPGVSLRASVNPSTQLSECLVPALTFACGVGRGLGPLQSHVVLGLSLAEKLGEKKCHCDCVFCKMCKCKISICRWLQVPHQRGDCHYQWGMGSAWQTWVQCKSLLLLHGYPASSAGMLEDGWHLAYSLQIAGQ